MRTKSFEGAIFLVWGPPGHGPRSQVFARELGIQQPYFIHSTLKRGFWVAPVKYLTQAIKTLKVLMREKPALVFVQSPPSLAVWVVYFYSIFTGCRYFIDAHSAAFLNPFWTNPKWLNRLAARKALATIVTNEHFQEEIQSWGATALVVRDVPTSFERATPPALDGTFNITVVNSFGPDEPLSEILAVAEKLPNIHFYITGRLRNSHLDQSARAPRNVTFTDFLPNDRYYALMTSSQAVLCLTTRNHTMQRGACEALWMGKPVVTSDWPLLREYFYQGTVHVDNTIQGIEAGILRLQADYAKYAKDILAMQASRRQEWLTKQAELLDLATGSGNMAARENVKVSGD